MAEPCTTYEKVVEAKEAYNKARTEYHNVYYNYLRTVLLDIGFHNKLVRLNGTNILGRFMIDTSPSNYRPYELKFYPLTKKGTISEKSKYLPNFRPWNELSLREQLCYLAEVVGDLP